MNGERTLPESRGDLMNSVDEIAHVIQISIGPVFVLTGVGTLLNVLSGRLARILDRARLLEQRLKLPDAPSQMASLKEFHIVQRRGLSDLPGHYLEYGRGASGVPAHCVTFRERNFALLHSRDRKRALRFRDARLHRKPDFFPARNLPCPSDLRDRSAPDDAKSRK